MRYKVGDRVRIKSLHWYEANSNVWGVVCFSDIPYFISSMKQYCSKVMTIAEIKNGVYYMKEDKSEFVWVDKMIEGLVEDSPDKETKTFYFVREPDHMIECSDCLPSGVNIEIIKQKHKIFDTQEEAENHQKELGLESEHNRAVLNKWFAESGLAEEYGYVRKQVITVETIEEEAKPKYEDEVSVEYYSTTKYLVRPSGYQFVDENGNVINARKIVLEKKDLLIRKK